MKTISTDLIMREEDIRPKKLMADKQHCVDWDRDFLLSRRNQWVVVNCPACEANNSQIFGKKDGFIYVECKDCKTVYTNPRPSQELLHSFYSQSKNYEYWNRHVYPATENVRRMTIFRPRAEKLIDYCKKYEFCNGTFLEIGAAFGTFCEEIRKYQFFKKIIAVEATPDLAETCREKDFDTIEKPIEFFENKEITDVIASFEVIEHLFNPYIFIKQCVQLLRPKGLLFLTCPNVQGFDVATLRMLSNTFDHEHINYFHPKSLFYLVNRLGLDVLDIQTPGKLDLDIVRKHVNNGTYVLSEQPFLQKVLIDDWDKLGNSFQEYLSSNQLSSHMWLVARKPH